MPAQVKLTFILNTHTLLRRQATEVLMQFLRLFVKNTWKSKSEQLTRTFAELADYFPWLFSVPPIPPFDNIIRDMIQEI